MKTYLWLEIRWFSIASHVSFFFFWGGMRWLVCHSPGTYRGPVWPEFPWKVVIRQGRSGMDLYQWCWNLPKKVSFRLLGMTPENQESDEVKVMIFVSSVASFWAIARRLPYVVWLQWGLLVENLEEQRPRSKVMFCTTILEWKKT